MSAALCKTGMVATIATAALAEFAGTAFFLFCILATSGMVYQFAAVGAALALAVFAVGSMSGGHLNPAVSVMLFSRGAIDMPRLAAYVAAQVAGGLAASLGAQALLRK